MLKPIAALVIAAAFAVPAAHATGGVELNDATKAKITEKLTAEGYDVGKIKIEDGLYEAYARKDGTRFEVFLDADLNVVRTEIDD